MKKSFYLGLVLLFSQLLSAQNYGNEWIKPDQKYFKFTILKKGIYRLEYFNLLAAATEMQVDLASVNPKKFQIFNQGKEIPIYVAGEQDNRFNVADFIEFYGQPNDGKLDSQLFQKNELNANPDFSMFTDSNVYYLTFIPSSSPQNGLRLYNYSNKNYSNFPELQNCIYTEKKVFTDRYNGGKDFSIAGQITSNPEYVNTEGYSSSLIGFGGNGSPILQHEFNTQFSTNSAFSPKVRFRYIGVNENVFYNNDHNMEVFLSKDNINYTKIHDTIFDGFQVIEKANDFSQSLLGPSSTYIRFSPVAINNISIQYFGVSAAEIKFPRFLELNQISNFNFELEKNVSPQYLNWKNYEIGKNRPIFYDLTNGYRIRGELNGVDVKMMTPSLTLDAQYFLIDSTNIINLRSNQIFPAMSSTTIDNQFIQFNPVSIINKHKFIMVTNEKLVGSYTTDFLNYKNTLTYIGNPTLVTVQQLYNHFSYGVPSPVAVKNFIRYMQEKGDTTFKFCFLVGRGYQSNLIRTSPNLINSNFVPSIGVPASDNLFASNKDETKLGPTVAIGRLTIDQPFQIGIYLNKLKQYDENKDDFWRKHLMHLAGGENSLEAINFTGRLNNSASIAKALPFGGKVTTYTKSSVGISEPFMKQKLLDVISKPDDNGVQFVTFLGHGSSSVSDVDVGDTAEYSNIGKYPIFYFNGCNIGNPCTGPPSKNVQLSGEKFINTSNKGAIAFIGQTSLSELGHVDRQIQEMYRIIFREKYTGEFTIGEAIQLVLNNTGNKISYLSVIQSRIMFLQGDPSLRIFQPQKTDYAIDNKTIYLTNDQAFSDSIGLAIPIVNKGLFSNDSFNIKVVRYYPNSFIKKEYTLRVKSIPYRDTVILFIKSKDGASSGINRFDIHINNDSAIDESNYDNNKAIYDYDIYGYTVNLVSPRRYDIVSKLNNDTIALIVQSLNIYDRNNKFEFEIDTTPNFNSPWLKKHNSSTIVGSTSAWKVKLMGTRDSIVYYWRAKFQGPKVDWDSRSFIHILNNEPGWSQSHHPQFYPSSETFRMNLNKLSRSFDFNITAEKVYINTATDKFPNFGIKKGGFNSRSLNPGTSGGILLILFDKNSLEQFRLNKIFNTTKFYYDGVNYDLYEKLVKAYNFWDGSPTQMAQFHEFVDSIPEGTYVAACNVGTNQRVSWSQETIDAFKKFGSKIVDSFISPYSSYAIIGQKGAPYGSAVEDTGTYQLNPFLDLSYIEVERELYGKRNKGTLQTEIIGPTTQWGGLHFWTSNEDIKPGDKFSVDIYGVNLQGKDTLIYKSIRTSPFDISSIDAKKYPSIYMVGNFEDLSNYTAPQLMHWRVTNSEVAEGTLTTTAFISNWRDTLQQGEKFEYEIGFENISKLAFGKNLEYEVSIFNIDTKDTIYKKVLQYSDSLLPNKFFKIGANINTKLLSGRYAFYVKVNMNNFNRSIIPELSLTNNSAIRYFFIEEDKINPLLDVTFDGKHITNGEIVSASPIITITSKDENKINWQTDSTGFMLWLKTPGSNQNFEKINFDTMGVKFFPATNNYNLAKLEFNPKGLPDGIYSLKVQSQDANKILAGTTEYLINFQVVNKESVTNFYPYPNPFTTAMRFVFTLTGNDVPDEISIKIMNIQGKVVKELNKEDLGNIRIGNNITDIVWDGTDQYGDRLANGVYLYTVTIKSKGTQLYQLDDNNTNQQLNADKQNNKYFKNSTGKIVLLR